MHAHKNQHKSQQFCTPPTPLHTNGDSNAFFTTVMINFLFLRPQRCIVWTGIDFFGTLWLKTLALGLSLLSMGNWCGCMVAQIHILYVACSLLRSWWTRGVHAGLLRGTVPCMPHFHLWANASRLEILLSDLHQSWVFLGSVSPWGIRQWCFFHHLVLHSLWD